MASLLKIIRDQYLIDAKAYNKVMGVPITKAELTEEVKKYLAPLPLKGEVAEAQGQSLTPAFS